MFYNSSLSTLVDPRGTSQEDSGYGIKDRDHNAAINILKRGLSTVGTTGRACLSCLDREAMIQEAHLLAGE